LARFKFRRYGMEKKSINKVILVAMWAMLLGSREADSDANRDCADDKREPVHAGAMEITDEDIVF
jgi:hypothetical protein